MNILLNKSKKYFLFLIIISFSIISSSESILTPDPHLSISTNGFITGKFEDFNLAKKKTFLSNHGTFYGEIFPELYYNKSNFISLGFSLKNFEFSEIEQFSLSPLIYAICQHMPTLEMTLQIPFLNGTLSQAFCHILPLDVV